MFENNDTVGAAIVPENKNLELRAYDIAVPVQNAIVKIPGLRTDSEHTNIIGFFLVDTDYNGSAETLDTKSKISLLINGEKIVTDVHAHMFFVNRGVSLAESAWKFLVPVSSSLIEAEFKDSGKFDVGAYPRTVTLYLIAEKKKK